MPCKISCCGITAWQIGAYKEYLEVGRQAAAAVTETKVVTQVVTTGAVVRSPELSSRQCVSSPTQNRWSPLRRLMILRVTENPSEARLEIGEKEGTGRERECW